MNLYEFLNNPTRFFFFTGKGGVGKTSVSCATSVALADKGRRVLLVSTDPASNLDEVLSVKLGSTPTPIPGVPNLEALNLDPEQTAAEYRERMVGPYRGILPEATVRSMEEQLSGSCTMEIAAFDEFSRLLGDPTRTAGFDHVIFDTAPTGHTLRLLSLPHAWSSFIETSSTGTSCLGPLAGLKEQQKLYIASVQALADGERTTLVMVSRPEASALREAERSRMELLDLGVSNQTLVLNGMFIATDDGDTLAKQFEKRCKDAMDQVPAGLALLPTFEVRLNRSAMLGVDSLRQMFAPVTITFQHRPKTSEPVTLPPSLASIVDELQTTGRGVIMTMGKGGVGKTTVAAAIALELANRGYKVSLSTTDPAAHVSWLIENPPPNLTVGRIDAENETVAYRAEVVDAVGSSLDDQGRALLDEDLRSPCTEEVAIFRTFAKTVADGQDGFVVLDTAPTGHTILLLDAAEAYHREVLRQSSNMPDTVKNLLPRLRDPEFTRTILVTLPEATPVHEAERLQHDLARAGIKPFAWVINQSFAPLKTSDPVLESRQANEHQYINEVCGRLATRIAIVPWLSEAPSGSRGLAAVVAGTTKR